MKTAVVYTSKVGNTKVAAEKIAKAIGADIFKLGTDDVDISQYERVILATGVYAGKISKAMDGFISQNDVKKASLVITCMYKGEKGAKQLESISNRYGIADAIFFNKSDIRNESEDSKLAEYIKSL